MTDPLRVPRRPSWAARFPATALLIGIGLGVAGCAVNPVTGESELMLVSEVDELALGHQAFPALRWQDGGPLQVDPATQAYLAEIVRGLHRVSHRPALPVDFTLHSASVPNAWAIPGHTAMHRGLLQSLENEAQFAFVMGHEMGHVAARHSAKRQTYGLVGGTLLGLGAAALGGGEGGLGELALGAAAAGTGLVLLKYDRGQELQADQLGVLYMARAGYDPGEALRAHAVLSRAADQYLANVGKRREDAGPFGDLLSTHPRHEARLAELRQVIQTLPPGEARLQGDGRLAERWLAQTASIRALAPAYLHYDRARLAATQQALPVAEREVGEALRGGEQAQFWNLRGAILARLGRLPEAQQAFARALALYPGYQPALQGLGVVEFHQGRYLSAAPYFGGSLAQRPGYLPATYLLGLSLARGGKPAEAVPHLRAVADSFPRHPEIHGVLADLYERTGDRRAAASAWQAQARVAPDSELGREARQRLQGLVTPYRSSAVRVRLLLPPLWEAHEQAGPWGREVVLRRAAPAVTVRIVSRESGQPGDLGARVDEWIQQRLAGQKPRVLDTDRSLHLGGAATVAKVVESRGSGGTARHLLASAARGSRVYWVDVVAPEAAWRDAEIREEIQRLLASIELS